MEYVTLLIEELKKQSISTLNNTNSNYKRKRPDPVYPNHLTTPKKHLTITKLTNTNTTTQSTIPIQIVIKVTIQIVRTVTKTVRTVTKIVIGHHHVLTMTLNTRHS